MFLQPRELISSRIQGIHFSASSYFTFPLIIPIQHFAGHFPLPWPSGIQPSGPRLGLAGDAAHHRGGVYLDAGFTLGAFDFHEKLVSVPGNAPGLLALSISKVLRVTRGTD